MKFKKTGAEKSTITREVNDLTDKTGNIFKAVSVLANRSKQINEKMKEELLSKLEEFALDQEQLDERVIFIKNGLQKLTSEEKSRKYIQAAVQSDYRKKFKKALTIKNKHQTLCMCGIAEKFYVCISFITCQSTTH